MHKSSKTDKCDAVGTTLERARGLGSAAPGGGRPLAGGCGWTPHRACHSPLATSLGRVARRAEALSTRGLGWTPSPQGRFTPAPSAGSRSAPRLTPRFRGCEAVASLHRTSSGSRVVSFLGFASPWTGDLKAGGQPGRGRPADGAGTTGRCAVGGAHSLSRAWARGIRTRVQRGMRLGAHAPLKFRLCCRKSGTAPGGTALGVGTPLRRAGARRCAPTPLGRLRACEGAVRPITVCAELHPCGMQFKNAPRTCGVLQWGSIGAAISLFGRLRWCIKVISREFVQRALPT